MKHLALLGDSIFDNRIYVGPNEDFIHHLQGMLPSTWRATLLAVDGDTTLLAMAQIPKVPESATHLILSIGGNDALQRVSALETPTRTVMEGLVTLHALQAEFLASYRLLIESLLELKKPLVVCTIYDAIPGLPRELVCALSLFNDVILREAIQHEIPVLDLRTVCTEAQDYSTISPIEPSSIGGHKIAVRIADFLENHDFNKPALHGFVA